MTLFDRRHCRWESPRRHVQRMLTTEILHEDCASHPCALVSSVCSATAALAATVTSYHGSGSQSRSTSYSNGVKVTGNLKSTQGYDVCYGGKVNVNGALCASSVTVGCHTSNTSTTSLVTRRGNMTTTLVSFCTTSSVASRISRVIPSPDLRATGRPTTDRT